MQRQEQSDFKARRVTGPFDLPGYRPRRGEILYVNLNRRPQGSGDVRPQGEPVRPLERPHVHARGRGRHEHG